MTDLQLFEYQGNQIRTIEREDGTTWWVLKDVCFVLDLTHPEMVAKRLDDDEATQIGVIDSLGRKQQTTVINEAGLYSVILRSDKPQAKGFKRWVTHEVLPSIRKHGSYIAPNREKQLAVEAKLNNSRARVSSLWLKLASKVDLPEYQQICTSYASAALAGHEVIPLPASTEHYYSAGEVGEILGISGNKVGRLANELGLKTDAFGKWFFDKSRSSNKEVQTFRYNDAGIEKLRAHLGKATA